MKQTKKQKTKGNGAAQVFSGAPTALFRHVKIDMAEFYLAMSSWLSAVGTLRTLAAVVSHTHTRTEGRAPVWSSEFTSKK
jgi:hypothetical protein